MKFLQKISADGYAPECILSILAIQGFVTAEPNNGYNIYTRLLNLTEFNEY